MKLRTRENGPKAKSQEKEKLFSKAEASSKDHLRMILKMDMERCTIIHQGIIFKENGKMTKNKARGQ